jgi:Skp family chaperone for outer membrane proteins
MKQLKMTAFALGMLLSAGYVSASDSKDLGKSETSSPAVKQIVERAEDIKSRDLESLTEDEMKALRSEMKQLKKDVNSLTKGERQQLSEEMRDLRDDVKARTNGGGLYISTGALIIIVLLIILL